MKTKICVYGKDRNQIALGILNAYVQLYPNLNLRDIQRAFPSSLNGEGSSEEVIVSISYASKRPGDYFIKPGELIESREGHKLVVKKHWEPSQYEAIKEYCKRYGIEVSELDEDELLEGGYRLERIDTPQEEEYDTVPEKEEEETFLRPRINKKTGYYWLGILLVLLIALLSILYLKKYHSKEGSSRLTQSASFLFPQHNIIPIKRTIFL